MTTLVASDVRITSSLTRRDAGIADRRCQTQAWPNEQLARP